MITCPTCQFFSHFPVFRCVRCADHLCDGTEARGNQVVLHFTGGLMRSLVVQRNGQPVFIEAVKIEGAVVYLTLAQGGGTEEHPTASLFEVLLKDEQLWNLG